jgi:cystathionine beta-lyase/cystathionine gamma-synthase
MMRPSMDEGLRFDSLAVRAADHLPNPLVQLEARIAALEASGLPGRGAWGVAFNSGRAALDALARLLRPGDKIALHNEVSSIAARAFAALSEWDITVEFNDFTDANLSFEGSSLVFVESPTSATLQSIDLARLVSKAHAAGALVAVDHSILTAFACRPLEFGVDVAVYSNAAALCGDATLALGALVGRNDEILERTRGHRDTVGARPNAQVCGSALRGLKTLSVRLERQSGVAKDLFAKLEGHDAVREAFSPLSSDVQHLTRDGRAMSGGVLALEFAASEAAKAFLDRLRGFELSDWAGGSDSTACLVGRSSHRALESYGLGLPDTWVRLSFGLEDASDLWKSLEVALNAALEHTPEPEPIEADEPEGAPNDPMPALTDTTLTLGNAPLERLERLMKWRDAVAIEENVSRFLVASNAILQRIAEANPDSLEALANVHGFGAKKLERYGQRILDVLREEPRAWAELLPSIEAPVAREKPNAVPVPINAAKRKRRRRRKGSPA